MKATWLYLIFLIILNSCTDNNRSDHPNNKSDEQIGTLRISFYDNIHSINPLKVSNESEQLIVDLVFEQFIQKADSNAHFQSSFIDKIKTNDQYTDIILKNRYLHSGKKVSADNVIGLLRKVWEDKELNNSLVQNTFMNIDGLPLSNWYRTNKNDYSVFPTGITTPDSLTIRFSMRKKDSLLIQKLSQFNLIISDSIYGTGSHRIKELNDDILCNLTGKDSTWNNVIIRFVKNEDYKISEFLNGGFDVIEYHPKLTNATVHKKFLDKEISNKYPEYQVFKSNKTLLNVAILKGNFDSLEFFYTHRILNSRTNERVKELISKSQQDSIDLAKITVTGDTSILNVNSAFNYQPIIQKDTEHNHILLKTVEVKTSNGVDFISEELKGKKYITLEKTPFYFIAQRNISGLDDFMSWKDVVHNVKFKTVKKY
ncbi:hypothetical protein [Reichenbachiella versicolor]|uniref:hypothetical protein n=1 Tax=Reichenbachiella versicolor TaxID=1821036 RepID=UPI000D6E88A7|nr:hypothetical protein [Reichenbachiella versicolor]